MMSSKVLRTGLLVPALLMLVVLSGGCIKEKFASLPGYQVSNLDNTVAIDTAYRRYFEGVYELADGDDLLGRQLVAKWANGYLCFYGENDGKFMNLEAGYNPADSSFRMAGFWFDPLQPQNGQVQFTMTRADGADSVVQGRSAGITLHGYLENDPGRAIVLRYKRGFSASVLSGDFILSAHRGGGRNSDNMPYAENSLDLVKHAERFGANGIEIDVRLTKDRVPIIYHDADLNTRLTLKSPLVGNINQFNADFLRAYIRLIDGQFIPTLDEMLTTIIDSTNLQHVWLDCKDGGSAGFFDYVVPVFRKAVSYARLKNRPISILLGLPTANAYYSFTSYEGHTGIPSLCELSFEEAVNAGARVFAPRWTLGILQQETISAHAMNMKVITWTLDDPEGMDKVIRESGYDGILTNYPSMLAYRYYSQE